MILKTLPYLFEGAPKKTVPDNQQEHWDILNLQVLQRSSKIVKTTQGRFIQQALTLSSALQLLQTSTECNNNLNNAHALDERLRSGCGDMLRLSGLPRTCPTCVLSPLVINNTVFTISSQLYTHTFPLVGSLQSEHN